MSRRESDPTAPRRLVDDPGARTSPEGSSDGWAVALVESAEPYRTAVARKQRMQLRLGQAPRRQVSLVLRAALALVVLVGLLAGGGAFARAALGRWPAWMVRVARAYERTIASPSPSVVAAPPRVRADAPPVVAAPTASPLVAAEPAVAPELAPESAVAAPAARAVTGRAPIAAPRGKPIAPTPSEDSTPVLEAMRALRRERDPVRARTLLGSYLERHPTGTLAEEALALTIEAAVAHRDPDAAGLAARYLRLYPAGPFRPLARQTLAAAAQQP